MRAVASAALAFALVAGCYRSHATGGDPPPRVDADLRRDVGARTDGGVAARCDEESLAPYEGPPCSDAVSACRRRCRDGDEPCRDACLDEPCRACVYGTIFHCAYEAGCEAVWHEFACCVESVPMCRDLRGFDRTRCADRCPMRFEPYATCIEEVGGVECFRRAARNCGLR